MKAVELIDGRFVGQNNVSALQPQPLGEVPTDEIVLVAETASVVRGQQQACVLDPSSGEHQEARTYHDAVTAAAHRDNTVHTATGEVGSDLDGTRSQQQADVRGHREVMPRIVEGGLRVLEDCRFQLGAASNEAAPNHWGLLRPDVGCVIERANAADAGGTRVIRVEVLPIKRPPELGPTFTRREVDRIERACGPTSVPKVRVSKGATESPNPGSVQPVDRVTVTLTATLALEALLEISSTRLKEADTNTTVVEFASDGDPSRPSPNDADVGENLLSVRHRFTSHESSPPSDWNVSLRAAAGRGTTEL
jgi:hypothetical protein